MDSQKLYEQYRQKMRRIADVRHANAVLQWDQETYLPPKGAAFRGQQISTLSEISHRMFIEDSFGVLLNELLSVGDLSASQKRNVELTKEDYDKNRKYTSEFVRKLSEQTNRSFHSWIDARKKNSFAVFKDDLSKMVELKKQEAGILGFKKHPYDALVNEYEKGCTTELLDKIFAGLLPSLREISSKIAAKPQVDDSFLQQHYPKNEQWEWGMFLVKELNFDFEAGRQDLSEHPFSTSFSMHDVRITTRVDEQDFGNMTWSCIHETGHALYEQGLPEEHYGLPLGEACSYSIHESQSRLWENNVGRGLPFWEHYYPILKERFPTQLGRVNPEDFYKGINKVQPSLIRTEADEINYHFHVFIRYELEKRLIEGSMDSSEIPAYWNEQYKKLLDIEVPDDKKGCLQDVHWSHGSFGYFPTYSLGSFYAAQFYNEANNNIQGLEKEISNGKFGALLQWLREKIHRNGRYFESEDLCKEITGKTLEVQYFLKYLLDKYSTIYNLY